jgi:hypothetical protein
MSQQREDAHESRPPDPNEMRSAVANVDVDNVLSPALKRLIEDVRNEPTPVVGVHGGYDRVHNRHNR